MRSTLFPLFLGLLLLAADLRAGGAYDFTADSYFSKPETRVTWRVGLGLGSGYCGTSELRELELHSLEAVRLLADVYPNRTAVDLVWLSVSLDYALLQKEPELNDLVSLDVAFGPYFRGFRLARIADVKWYIGPSFSMLMYFYSPNRRTIGYGDADPLFGLLSGLEAGAETFFSPAFSWFVQARYRSGRVQVIRFESPNSTKPVAYPLPHKNLGVFELTTGVRFYFGQDQFWTPMNGRGFAER